VKPVALFAVAFAVAACVPPGWQAIPKPPLRDFEPQQPKRLELPNGMVVLLQEDHELPLIEGFARVRGGSWHEPADKAGLLTIYGEAWRTGGTKTKTGDELDDFLEARAANVETGGGGDSTGISFSCLKENLDEVFAVFLDLLRNPEFREDKIKLAKVQLATLISRRNDDAGGIATREAQKLAYGPTSPYARVPEYASVAAVTRDDLLAWHAARVQPNNILVGLSGDFDAGAMEARLRQAFGAWPRGPAAPAEKIPIAEAKPGIYFVAKDDVNQSYIRMVHLGTRRDNPDFYALEVMNELFGGGMGSRLFANLRTKRGLAYSVGGGVGVAYDHPGVAQLAMGTKSQSTAAGITGLLAELEDLQKSPPTTEEIRAAKESLLNSFIFRFDSKAKILRERLRLEFYGYPPDLLARFRPGIERVTAENVLRVARQYLRKDQLRILVVGNAAAFDRPLKSFGPVTNVDITIPPPPSG
jgi:zinc protease